MGLGGGGGGGGGGGIILSFGCISRVDYIEIHEFIYLLVRGQK